MMIHLGDITKINGADIPIVDIITGSSPCQDLSVAGKRAGLAGDRSGLFMEQIRIIKEMREKSARISADNIRPRYMVWENVPGAFSSNKGEDFRVVLEETARVVDKTAIIPRPEGGRWSTSGCIMADGWSIAWRVHDAQFWGVPQRRKRIALVADFDGQTAPEILFERKSLSGNTAESGETRERTAADAERSANETISFLERAGCAGGGVKAYSYKENEQEPCQHSTISESCNGVKCFNPWDAQSARCYSADGVWHSLNANENGGQPRDAVCYGRGNNEREVVYCLQGNGIDRADTAGCNGKGWRGNECYTLNTIDRHAVCVFENHAQDSRFRECSDGIAQTVSATYGMGGNNQPLVVDKEKIYYSSKNTFHTCFDDNEIAGTLIATDYKDTPTVTSTSTVRRLTPLECERLQGFPDGWTDIGDWTDSKGKIRKTSDSARYKALGNSIALPFWQWLANRIVKRYSKQPTMASLFDGIGGFPLVFSRTGATPIWASEIEEFPIAVTKIHFGEGE